MPEFRELARNVYAFLQPPLIWYSSAGVIVGEKDVILVDSLANAEMTGRLRAEIRRVTDEPVRFLVNTHSHADHVYTNHLFPEATVIGSQEGRRETEANRRVQKKHDALLARLFSDVDLGGGRYTLQDMTFSGRLSFHHGEREVRVLDLGPGHSESDVVVHLPADRIVFCGDVFMNGMPPLPGEGRVSRTIANYRALEALEADVYVAGHGDAGTLSDVRAQRMLLESQFRLVRECNDRGLSYDQALQAVAGKGLPLAYQRLIVLAGYQEFTGKRPETTDPASQNHLTILQAVAAEARRRLEMKTPRVTA